MVEASLPSGSMAMSRSGDYKRPYVGLWSDSSQGLCLYPWHLLPLSAMLTSVGRAASWDQDRVRE